MDRYDGPVSHLTAYRLARIEHCEQGVQKDCRTFSDDGTRYYAGQHWHLRLGRIHKRISLSWVSGPTAY